MNPLWFIALGVLWFLLAVFIWALCLAAARAEADAQRAGPPPPVKDCRAPSGLCPRWTSCARHNECEWEPWEV